MTMIKIMIKIMTNGNLGDLGLKGLAVDSQARSGFHERDDALVGHFGVHEV